MYEENGYFYLQSPEEAKADMKGKPRIVTTNKWQLGFTRHNMYDGCIMNRLCLGHHIIVWCTHSKTNQPT